MDTPSALTVVTNTLAAVLASPQNDLRFAEPEPFFDSPLVGFASGADPLFSFYKEDIGSFYWSPAEAFALAFPDEPAAPEELSVVSYVLPQTERTRADQRAAKDCPCHRWAHVYVYGEKFNVHVRRTLAASLTAAGFPAVAPMLLPQWSWQESSAYGRASSWSERHTAYIAGLGTFGLCDALITRCGKAHRLGSVVVRASLPVAPRPYSGHHDWCGAFDASGAYTGACSACMRRCPAGAITAQGHDKRICEQYIEAKIKPLSLERYGLTLPFSGCGLCQVGVPCEVGPVKKK